MTRAYLWSKGARRLALVLGGIAAVVASSAYLVGRARAAGIPAAQPLVYSGVLTDTSGALLTGSKNIQVIVWDAATAGTMQCTVGPMAQTLVGGSFQVPLAAACVTAVRTTPDLWAELFVDGGSLGRNKLGAVPYAVEATHAVNADHATGGFDVQNGTFSVVGSTGQRSVIAGVTGCTPAATYAGLSVQGALSGCTNYSMLGDGSTLFLNRPTGGAMRFRMNNTDQMILDSAGNLQALSSTNPVNFTAAWGGSPDPATNVSEISNDTNSYKTLMIVGNRSGGVLATGGGIARRVSVWDRLEVNGNLAVTGTISQASTETVKKDIRAFSKSDYDHVMEQLEKTDVYHYRYRAEVPGDRGHVGVIAERSPAEIIDPSGKAVNMLDYSGFLLATVKGQQAEIKQLKKELQEIKRSLAGRQQ
jgi:hypothetical protein